MQSIKVGDRVRLIVDELRETEIIFGTIVPDGEMADDENKGKDIKI